MYIGEDHPRSRGVYEAEGDEGRRRAGSSPLARGLPERCRQQRAVAGIIPARAGFTTACARNSGSPRDHPRSRGVYGGDPVPGVDGCGSSPLARGLRGTVDQVSGYAGIIPARAGFTSSLRKAIIFAPDHPRSRGVYHTVLTISASPAGSSPLARGLRSYWR